MRISTGYDEGYGCWAFRPLDTVKRDAMAAFMHRLENGGAGTAPSGTGCTAHQPAGIDVTKQLLIYVNNARAAAGVAPLRYMPSLVLSACAHSTWMQQTGSFQHSSSSAGWHGENIAWGFTSVAAVFDGWMNSPGHHANIVRPWFTHMGACKSDTGTYWTQEFY